MRKTPVSRRLVTLTEAADYAACNERTIRRRIASGDLTAYRLGKRLLRVDLDELDAAMQPVPTVGNAS